MRYSDGSAVVHVIVGTLSHVISESSSVFRKSTKRKIQPTIPLAIPKINEATPSRGRGEKS